MTFVADDGQVSRRLWNKSSIEVFHLLHRLNPSLSRVDLPTAGVSVEVRFRLSMFMEGKEGVFLRVSWLSLGE